MSEATVHDGRPAPTPGEATLQASLLLVDAWGTAMNHSYSLGYGNGYAAGFHAAEKEMADAWARAAKPVRDVLSMPARGERR